MANIKSAKKQAKQNVKRNAINTARRSDVKTAVKKVLVAIEKQEKPELVVELLRSAEAKIARAKHKTLHPNTADRKVSRLAKRVAIYARAA